MLVGLQSDDEDGSTQVERVKAAVSDVRPTDTERRVDDVTNRTSRLEGKHDGTERRIKDVSSKLVQQNATHEKQVQDLENKMTNVNSDLHARIGTEVSDLKAKIRQVASEDTVFEGRFTMTRQPNAVHVGE